MAVQVNIIFRDNGLAQRFKRKGTAITSQQRRLLNSMLSIANRHVKLAAPRKTGKLMASTTSLPRGDSHGYVDVGRGAPYFRWVIDGRGAVSGINGPLRFTINGVVLYRWSVGPSKPNPYVDKAAHTMGSEMKRAVDVFGKWMEEV